MAVHQLKAIFIMALLAGNVIAFGHSAYALAMSQHLAWLLACVATGAVSFVFLLYIGTGKRARTSARLPLLLATTSLCSLIALLSGSRGLALFYTLGLATIGAWLYVFWYSKLARTAGMLTTGQTLPPLRFYNQHNEPVDTADLNQPLLLVFYRGNWCPLCTAQVEEVAQHYQALQQRGYAALLISPQPQKETQKIARRFNVPLIFCEDRDGAVARQLGIFHPRGLPIGMEKMGYSADTVLPTVIITDADKNIIWLHETDNYRVRPEPQTFLDAIDAAGVN